MMLFDRLIDDARLLAPGADPSALLRQRAWSGEAPGSLRQLVVPDRDLSRLAAAVPAGRRIPVSVVNTSGAGGLLSLARRSWPQLDVRSAESSLRDLDDLAGSAARVVAAAAELALEIEVFVGLPYAPGWQRAMEVVEAAGRFGLLELGGVGPEVAVEQLSGLIEADLPFKVSGLDVRRLGPLLVTVAALVGNADLGAATQLLGAADPDESATAIAGWDDSTQTRVRRRLLSYSSSDPEAALALLRGVGLFRAG